MDRPVREQTIVSGTDVAIVRVPAGTHTERGRPTADCKGFTERALRIFALDPKIDREWTRVSIQDTIAFWSDLRCRPETRWTRLFRVRRFC